MDSVDVFVSYAAADRSLAEDIVAALEAAGLTCWIAPRDIAPGTVYAEAISGAIATARLVLVVLSTHSNQSPHVRRELERATTRNLPMLVVKKDQTIPSLALEYFISDSQWFDATSGSLDLDHQALRERVGALLAGPPRAQDDLEHLRNDPAQATEARHKLLALDERVRDDPRNAEALRERGSLLARVHSFQAAIEDFDAAIALRPDDPISYFYLGLAHFNTGKYRAAVDDCDRALSLHADYFIAHYVKGIALSNLQQDEAAIKAYTAAIACAPDVSVVYRSRASSYQRLNRQDLALADLTAAVEAAPDQSGAYLDRGEQYLAFDRLDLAEADFRGALALQPSLAAAHRNLGNVLRQKGDLAGAVFHASEAIRLDPSDMKARLLRALSRSVMGENRVAIEDLDVILRHDSEWTELYSFRADNYRAIGHHGHALEDYSTAIARGYADAYRSRGATLFDAHRYSEAIDDLTKAIQHRPDDAEAYNWRGVALYATDKLDEALDDLNTAVALDPTLGIAHFNRGSTLKELGRPDEAASAYATARQLGVEMPATSGL